MKRILIFAMLLGSTAFFQRPDLAATLDGLTVLGPARRANSAATSAAVDIANYGAVAMAVTTGQIDKLNIATFVLQDSGSAHSWTSVDSITFALAADTATHYKDLAYRGNQRYLRVVERASGSSADTVTAATFLFASFKRAR